MALLPEALIDNELIDEHYLRGRREVDAEHLPEGGHDVETPEQCWERAADRARRHDPDGSIAFALLRQLQTRSSR